MDLKGSLRLSHPDTDPRALALRAFSRFGRVIMPGVRLRASGGLRGPADGVFLEVHILSFIRFERLMLRFDLLLLPPRFIPLVFPDALSIAVEHHLFV